MLRQIRREASTKKRPKGRKGLHAGAFDPRGDHRSYTPQSVATIPPRVHLKPIVDKMLTACAREGVRAFLPDARDGEKRATYVIHPSQLGGCQKKAFFSFVHAPKDSRPPDPRLQRIFDVGHEGHRRIQGYFFEAWKRGTNGVTRAWEDVKLEIPGFSVRGELDAIIEIMGRHRYLVEIKTASSSQFDKLREPKIEWVWQSHIYMKAVGLQAAVVYVECKNNQEVKEFFLPFDNKVWAQIEESMTTLIYHATDQEIPSEVETSMCRFCDYQGACKGQKSVDWGKVERNWVKPW